MPDAEYYNYGVIEDIYLHSSTYTPFRTARYIDGRRYFGKKEGHMRENIIFRFSDIIEARCLSPLSIPLSPRPRNTFKTTHYPYQYPAAAHDDYFLKSRQIS